MENRDVVTSNGENDITLKELIFNLKEYYKEVVLNWKLMFVVTLLLSTFLFYKAFSHPTNFPATLTFMLNEEDGDIGGMAGLAATFGFGGGSSEYNLAKIMALSRSRNIIQQLLFKGSSTTNYLANQIILEYDMHDDWLDDTTGLKGFLFTHDSLAFFDRVSNSVLKELHNGLIGNPEKGKDGLITSYVDESTGIMSLTVSTTSEELSIQLVENLFKILSEFYITKSTEKQQATFKIAQFKSDSLLNLLNTVQYKYLKFGDTNHNLRLNQYEAQKIKMKRDIQVLTLVYGEALKNKEIADFSLRSKTPFIQVVDFPLAPLDPDKTIMSYISNLVLGIFLGVFLSFVYIIGRKVLRESLI